MSLFKGREELKIEGDVLGLYRERSCGGRAGFVGCISFGVGNGSWVKKKPSSLNTHSQLTRNGRCPHVITRDQPERTPLNLNLNKIIRSILSARHGFAKYDE